MSNIRALVLGLGVALAIVAMAAAGASAALPEFRQGGSPIAKKVAFTATGGSGLLETLGGRKVECSSDSAAGEISTPKLVTKIVVTFLGCKGPSSTTCTTTSLPAGTVHTKELNGQLGYVAGTAEGAKKVGLLLLPVTPTLFAEFRCTFLGSGPTIKISGDIIAQITKVNVSEVAAKLIFNQLAGKPEFEHFEGGPGKLLLIEGTGMEAFSQEMSGLKSENAMTLKEAVELKA